MAMADLNNILELCGELEIKLEEAVNSEERRDIIIEHLHLTSSKFKFIVPEFPRGLEWLNSSPLTMSKHLMGKVAVLDFFTYCCMNCIHVIPDLEALEQKYSIEEGVVVVGVHSAKFQNEKVLDNVRNAVLRHSIHHPVVNDPDAFLWNELLINCWPTFVLLGPENQYIHSFAGEGNRQKLLEFVQITLDYYKESQTIQPHSLPISLEKDREKNNFLQFPGKLCVNSNGSKLYIADSGNNRILVCDTSKGCVQMSIGGLQKGFHDGSFTTARFSNPQGLILDGHVLYVADTDNHSIRKVDFSLKQVMTLVGTGFQGKDKEGGNIGTQQELSSPFDLLLVPSLDAEENNILLIALAGSHQIWAYFLKDGLWFKGKKYSEGTCIRVAGSGNEENRNNTYPEKASFAQPSGLAYSPSKRLVFIADCESSSIRSFDLKSGAVKALVGAERNPMNLFAFGDVDGVGIDAKLQHPLGVCLLADFPETHLLVADTYNHKIKCVDLQTKNCTTVIGSGQPGDDICVDPRMSLFNEPAGLAVDRDKQVVYIADTNNHCIKVFNMNTHTLTELSLSKDLFHGVSDVVKSVVKPTNRITPKRTKPKVLETVNVVPSGWIQFKLDISFKDGICFTKDMVSYWQIIAEDEPSKKLLEEIPVTSGTLSDLSKQPTIRVCIAKGMSTDNPVLLHLIFECLLYTCSSAGTCNMNPLLFNQPINVSENGLHENEILLRHTVV